MPAQLHLVGIDPPPPAEHRLIFVLKPDASSIALARDVFERLRKQHNLQGAPIRPTLLHVTLCHLSDFAEFPQAIVDAAKEVAATIRMPPFDITFDYVMSFRRQGGKQPLVLCGDTDAAGVMAFERQLGTALAKAGLGGGLAHSSFTPHMTLAYDRHVEKQPVEKISWTAREFVLVHSLLGKTQHKDLRKWPLQS
jgi:2'-5' RNA ligase